MRRLRRLMFVVVTVAAGCGDGDGSSVSPPVPTEVIEGESGLTAPDPDSLPEAVAPQGLDEVTLPDRAEDITALFDRLPSDLVGGTRTDESSGNDPQGITASYGSTQPVGCGTVGLQAMNVSTGDFFPQDWTAETVVAAFTTGADWTVEDFGRDGDLFWVQIATTCSSESSSTVDSVSAMSWGARGSPWVFSASAGDPDSRDQLTSAFVTASR